MDPIPTSQLNNQKENEQININVPPPNAFKLEPQSPKSIDMQPKNVAPMPPPVTPANKSLGAKPDKKTNTPDVVLAPNEPIGDGAEGNKSFKMMMAGTIIFLTILLIAGVFIFKKGAIVPAPTNSPVVSPTPTPTIDPNLDSDKDGIPDVVEAAIGTNPNNTDTDGDIFMDLNEIKNGHSPLITGPAGKYTPEQWQAVRDRIKAADEGFYEEIFNE